MNFIPALIKKTIYFKRMPKKHVKEYEIYAKYKDKNYESGIRNELLEKIENPSQPDNYIKKINLKYNDNLTWKLPNDIYLDRDHRIKIYINGFILSNMAYKHNKVLNLISIDKVIKKCEITDIIELEYYQDIIKRTYTLENNCDIYIKPIFNENYSYGNHNIIL